MQLPFLVGFFFPPSATLNIISLQIYRAALDKSVSGILVYTSINADNKIINTVTKYRKQLYLWEWPALKQ